MSQTWWMATDGIIKKYLKILIWSFIEDSQDAFEIEWFDYQLPLIYNRYNLFLFSDYFLACFKNIIHLLLLYLRV